MYAQSIDRHPGCDFCCGAVRKKRFSPKFDAEKIRAHVKYLASDELEGRGMNQKGGDLAADYIAAQFKAMASRLRATTALTSSKSRWSA